MKKGNTPPPSRQTKKKNYFNPYDNSGTDRMSVHTYRTQSSTRPSSKQRTSSVTPLKKKKTTKKEAKGKKVTPIKSVTKTPQPVTPQTKIRPQNTKISSTPGRHLVKTKSLTAKQKERLRKRRQRMMYYRMALVMCLIIGGIWGTVSLKDYLIKTTVSTQVVKSGHLDTSVSLEGVVLRSEKVIQSEDAGNVRYVVAEGEKVKKDGVVYVLVDEEKVNSTTTQKQEVEEQIYHNAENTADLATNQDQRYNLDQQVKTYFNDYYNYAFDNHVSAVYTLRSQLDSAVSNRTDLYVAQQKDKDQDLITLKEQLDEALGKYQYGKKAGTSGLISYRTDGHETPDVASALENMDYNTYNELRKVTTITQLGQSSIEKEAPIYKLILSNSWYIVTYIEAASDIYEVGKNYELYFDALGEQPVNFDLLTKKEEGERIQLVFKTNNQIGEFLATRSVDFTIGKKQATGLKIPTQAIVEQVLIKIPKTYTVTDDETIGVYRQKGESTEFVSLNVQSSTEDGSGYYTIQDLNNARQIQVNDILVDPEGGTTYQVNEMTTRQGVYVVNGKIAKFRQIEIAVKNNDYAIVNEGNQTQLKSSDKIISDPKGVKLDQLLDDLNVQNE